MAKPNQQLSYAIAWKLFGNLQSIYKSGVENLAKSHPSEYEDINGYCWCGLSIYPLSVAVWEAYLNETCMSIKAMERFPNSVIWNIRDKADWWNIEEKTVHIPMLLMGKTFDKSTQPYQDFSLLVKIRNHIVHFRPEILPEKALEYFYQRRLTLKPKADNQPWHLQIESTECVRWAINVISKMVHQLESLFPDDYGTQPSVFFNEISKNDAQKMFNEASDPNNRKEV